MLLITFVNVLIDFIDYYVDILNCIWYIIHKGLWRKTVIGLRKLYDKALSYISDLAGAGAVYSSCAADVVRQASRYNASLHPGVQAGIHRVGTHGSSGRGLRLVSLNGRPGWLGYRRRNCFRAGAEEQH